MKNKYIESIILSIFLMQATNLFSQQNSKFSLGFETGIIQGDLNDENDYIFDYLTNEDYSARSANSGPAPGFNLGVGLFYRLSQKNELEFSTSYTILGASVFGSTSRLKSTVVRPLSNEVPIQLDGRINYSLLNIGSNFIHNFKGYDTDGAFLSIGVHYLINLRTEWKVDVTYETGNTDTQNNISDFSSKDFNNLVATNFRLGYNVIVRNKFRLSPSVGIGLGLNKVVENTIFHPIYLSFNLRFNWLK